MWWTVLGVALAAPWTAELEVHGRAPGGDLTTVTEASGSTIRLPSCSRLQLSVTPSAAVHAVGFYWEDDRPDDLVVLWPTDGPAVLPAGVRSSVPSARSFCLDQDPGTEEFILVLSATPITDDVLRDVAGVTPAPRPRPGPRPAPVPAPDDGAELMKDAAVRAALGALRSNFKGMGLGLPILEPGTVRLTADGRGLAAYALTIDHTAGAAACDCQPAPVER